MAQLSASELRKYDWRPEVFIKKIQDKSPFEIKNGSKVILIMPQNGAKILRQGSVSDLNEIRFADTKGKIYKISDIVKTNEFGGRGVGSGTAKEDAALASLRKQIAAAKKKDGTATLKIAIGRKTYDVFDAVSTPGTPKSDFHLVDVDGNEIVWISHKDGRTAKDFQQWGGMSQTKEPDIYRHTEVQKFIKDILKMYPKGLPRATTLARKIKDQKLKNMSVYGNQFGKQFGQQNVTLTLQGDIQLTKSGSKYKITAHHTHLNGEKLTDDYDPVFMAIYKGDRSDFGIAGTRVVIAPAGSRKITEFV